VCPIDHGIEPEQERDERDWNQVKRAPSTTTEEILYTPLLLSSVETLTRTSLRRYYNEREPIAMICINKTRALGYNERTVCSIRISQGKKRAPSLLPLSIWKKKERDIK